MRIILDSVEEIYDSGSTKAIRSLETDTHPTGNIIFGGDTSSIETLNPHVNTTSVIAGSSGSSGYQEGVGSSAKFRVIEGIRLWNRTLLLVSDSGNHCLRYVERMSKRTGTFVGLCSSSGFINGVGTDARLDYPIDLVPDRTNPECIDC